MNFYIFLCFADEESTSFSYGGTGSLFFLPFLCEDSYSISLRKIHPGGRARGRGGN
jgi:hypothetical protein